MSNLPAAHAEFALLSRQELHALANSIPEAEPVTIDYCIAFILAETKGLWHGRARALMCRRLKHLPLGRTNREKLLACILCRLESGTFSEQFKDQLRLALHLDVNQTLAACKRAAASNKPHVRRYAAWALTLHRVA